LSGSLPREEGIATASPIPGGFLGSHIETM
jgi:hypothetical protein